jgi:SP family sugar:H+ symporter-like MFS transporter
MTIMERFYRKRAAATTEDIHEKGTPNTHSPLDTPPRGNSDVVQASDLAPGKVPPIAIVLGAVASIGGFMFGYESGQISGFLEMSDFKTRFGENGEFSAVRAGAIVGLLA